MAQRLSPHMTVMANAAQKAGKRLLRDFNEVEQLQVSIKGPSDFVSQADLRSEQILYEELDKARPGYAFLMEESGARGSENWAWRWVIDPLDGTTNFLHGIPHWAISIGLERRLPDGGSEIAVGLVYNPATDEMYWAEKGAGAWVNDRRLRVSGRREMKDALFATGIPFAAVTPARRLAFARTLGQLMPTVAGVRRFGSAALDLAWVAAGRYDGYWELGLKPWDLTAGVLIVREAGGYATDPAGGDPRGGDVVAGNPHLHGPLAAVVRDGMEAAHPAPPHPTALPPLPPVDKGAPGLAEKIPFGVRLVFGAARSDFNPAADSALLALADAGKTDATLIYNVYAHAPGTPQDTSTPRRLSLERALGVRSALIHAGIVSTRIYVHAMGANGLTQNAPDDRVDVTLADLASDKPSAAPTTAAATGSPIAP